MIPARGALALLVAAILVQALALPGPFLGYEHDDAVYVLAARALADEHAYRFSTLPGFPPIHLFPPGLPLLIAPWAWAFPDRPGIYALCAWTWLVACDILAWIWLRRRLGDGAGACAFLLFALHPLLLARAGVVMPEAPYLALALAFVLLAERKRRSPLGEGAIVAAGWLVRPGAVALLPALLAGALRERRFRWAGAALAPLALFWSLWSIWTSGRIEEFRELAATEALAPARLLADAGGNFVYYAQSLGAAFWPVNASGAFVPGLLLLILAGAGVRAALRRDSADPCAWVVLGWCGMHLVWPWRFERYLVAVWPFLAAVILEGARALAPRLGKRLSDPAIALALGLALLQAGLSSWRWVLAPPIPSRPPLAATYQWIQQHLAPNTVLASVYWGRDTVHAQRSFVAVPDVPNEAELLKRLRALRIQHVLWIGVPDTGLPPGSASDAALNRLDGILRDWPVAFTEDGGARLYRVPVK